LKLTSNNSMAKDYKIGNKYCGIKRNFNIAFLEDKIYIGLNYGIKNKNISLAKDNTDNDNSNGNNNGIGNNNVFDNEHQKNENNVLNLLYKTTTKPKKIKYNNEINNKKLYSPFISDIKMESSLVINSNNNNYNNILRNKYEYD